MCTGKHEDLLPASRANKVTQEIRLASYRKGERPDPETGSLVFWFA